MVGSIDNDFCGTDMTIGTGTTQVLTYVILFRIFVERSSTIERCCQPPPKFGNDCNSRQPTRSHN
jgi:hypothetical protein